MTAFVPHQSQPAQTCRLGAWHVTTVYRNAARRSSPHSSSVIAMKGERARVLRKNCGRWELRFRRRTESGIDDYWLTLGEVEDPEIALRIWLGLISGDDRR